MVAEPETKTRSRRVIETAARAITLAAMFSLLWRARSGFIRPFATAFFLAYAAAKPRSISAAALYFLTAPVIAREAGFLIAAAVTAVLGAALSVCIKKIPPRALLPLGVVAQSGFLYIALSSGEPPVYAIVNLAISLAFSYVSFVAIKAATSPLRKKHVSEFACMGVVVAVFGCGAASVSAFGTNLTVVLMTLVSLVFARVGSAGLAFGAAISLGLGSALYDFSVETLALSACVVAVAITFSGAARALPAFAAVMITAAFKLYFNVDVTALTAELVAVAVGGAVSALLPKASLHALGRLIEPPHADSAVRAIVSRDRERAKTRLSGVAAVFSDLARYVRESAVPEGCSATDIEKLLTSGVCENCAMKGECPSREAVSAISEIAAVSGRVSLSQVPQLVECDCPRAAQLLSVAGELGAAAQRKTRERSRANAERRELGEWLEGASALIFRAADAFGVPLTGDKENERALVDELSLSGIPCGEALVDGHGVTIAAAVGADSGKIAAIASKLLHSAYSVELVAPSQSPGYELVTLTEKTVFDAVFAAEGIAKNREATGDAHSFMRVSDTKFMMALCDGMGSGEGASRIASRAVDLVENFYRAGFDGDFALKQINRFLSVDSEESFAAFDILVCDLDTLEYTLIKLGSPASFIKDSEGVTRVDGNALPLGALKEITPYIYNGVAIDGQTIIFTSDGVSDCFEGESLAHLINSLTSLNVRSLCKEIVNEAKKAAGGEVRDDMTAVAVRVIKRV